MRTRTDPFPPGSGYALPRTAARAPEELHLARFHAPAIPHTVGQKLVDAGLLAREAAGASADVILVGGAFRYLPAFWIQAGALTPDEDGRGFVLGARTPEGQSAIRDRCAEFWKWAGAPEGWARVEASAALEALLAGGPSAAWADAPAPGVARTAVDG